MKGLASIETKKLILDQIGEDDLLCPKHFWCNNSLSKSEHCCFWHWIFYPYGGPERDGRYHPVYEYEQILLNDLEQNKLLAVFKATGLGLTEFILLWIIWKSLTDPSFQDKEAIIITGPNVDLAKDLISRTKKFLERKEIDFVDHGEYELILNGSRIKCYPSNNIASARGKPRVSIFFGDEAAFFKIKNDETVRTVGERYIGKSNSWVVWVSTAGEETSGFYFKLMNEVDCDYTRRHFYAEWGLKKDPKLGYSLFTEAFIEKAKKQKSYRREYMGEWGANVGDIFDQQAIDQICGDDYTINPENNSYDRIMAIDPGYGTSRFGIVVMQKMNGMPHVVYADDFERASSSQMYKKIDEIASRYHIRSIRCDASRPEVIKELRETYHYDVIGYAFKELGARMTLNASEQVGKLKVRIHKMFTKLKFQITTIKYNGKGMPDKTDANPFDIGDAFIMALWYYFMGGSGVCVTVY